MVQVRLHVIGVADELVQLPINCADEVSDLRGRPLPENAPGAGIRRAQQLRGLIHQQVKFQDVDWPWTGEAGVWEVQDVMILERAATMDRHQGKRRAALVAQVILRRQVIT
jgi:hypothetical protein